MAIKQESKPINASTIKYLAFEGGGGKGIVYSGAINILERPDVGILPITTNKLEGISGASAGAITAFFISLGMKSADISEQVDSNVFGTFYDDPNPGVYKAVKVKPGVIEAGYATDNYIIDDPSPEKSMRMNYNSGIPRLEEVTEKDPATFKAVEFGNPKTFFLNKATAVGTGRTNQQIFSSFYGLGLISLGTKFLRLRSKAKKSENPFLAKFGEKKENLSLYIYSLLMDRGLFTGFAVRDYLQKMAFVHLYKNYGTTSPFEPLYRAFKKANGQKEFDEAQIKTYDYAFVSNTLTFDLLKSITGKDLYITGTNLTQNRAVIFSDKHTGNFPVVEAVCCSMSIPFVFKPTYVNYETPHGENYNGFYIDGGTLNNLPLHMWDDGPDQPLNPNVVGIRVTDGYDPADSDYKSDPVWKEYLKYLKAEVYKKEADVQRYLKRIETFKDYGTANSFTDTYDQKGAFTGFLKMLGELFGTVLWPAEDGQIRTQEERDRTIEYFSYDVDMLNFSPQADLKKFIIQRAERKTKQRLNLS